MTDQYQHHEAMRGSYRNSIPGRWVWIAARISAERERRAERRRAWFRGWTFFGRVLKFRRA